MPVAAAVSEQCKYEIKYSLSERTFLTKNDACAEEGGYKIQLEKGVVFDCDPYLDNQCACSCSCSMSASKLFPTSRQHTDASLSAYKPESSMIAFVYLWYRTTHEICTQAPAIQA